MTAPSKLKGNTFEREISTLLNNKYQTSEFSRAPGSGAYFGGQNKSKAGTAHSIETLTGDIITPLDFPYSIECKSYSPQTGPNFYAIITGQDRTLDKWIAQAESDASKKNKQPLLFIKITRKGTYFVTRTSSIKSPISVPSTIYYSNDQQYSMFSITHINLI